ncbi:MAG TPA: tetratricopeptide repeat protein [Terriglobales bacterium]|nr:tetratricopeptide repeat protein [Terriglobales bacterium]
MPSATQTAPAVAECQHCGAEVPPESGHCPSCGRLQRDRSTKITLAIALLLVLAGVILTQWFVSLHRQTELGLARRWFARGEQAMQAQLYKFAAEAYRTALNYDRENDEYRLRLAQALVADNRLAEAHAHLITLWAEEPANGEVNLTLARLEARRGHATEAVRYYNDAINSVWSDAPRRHRNETRLELARYLMQQRSPARAQAELLALLADAPTIPADQLMLAQMLLEVNDPEHSLQAFSALLTKDSGNAQAWLGESEAYLALGNYLEAAHAAAKAVDHDPKLEEARSQLELTREIARIDPAPRGLPLSERADRAARAFDTALTRLQACASQQHLDLAAPATAPANDASTGSAAAGVAAPNSLQLLYTSGLQKQADATAQALRKNPDAIDPTLQYVFEVENATVPICPEMSLADRALLTLAQHESEPPPK